jgi:hypothetical protein
MWRNECVGEGRGAMILSAKGEGKNHYESLMYDSDI